MGTVEREEINKSVAEYLDVVFSISRLESTKKALEVYILELLKHRKIFILQHNGKEVVIQIKTNTRFIIKHNAPFVLKELIPTDIYEEVCIKTDILDSNKINRMIKKGIIEGSVLAKIFYITEYQELLVVPRYKKPN